eukprot:TRINITY_DN35755_c0_g1_i1.p1 TRINITY_DN35755_c0_g1~~TRINITY_DN35755_c0_g1_i1.p1  ORF type:complete len:645 (-),score=141.04 TRINITY_DN35755_c0_g1_i1:114-1883(-)
MVLYKRAPPELRMHIAPASGFAPIKVYAVIDPLSKEAQRLPPLLKLLAEELDAEISIVLAPKELVKAPLTGFYRAAVAAPAPPGGLAALGDWSGIVSKPSFNLPPRRGLLLSAQLHAPEAWLVVSAGATGGADLDALQARSPAVVDVRYVLQELFLEGIAYLTIDGQVAKAAAGRHLVLDSPNNGGETTGHAGAESTVVRTGYFQLRQKPGLYRLSLGSGVDGEMLVRPTTGVKLTDLAGRGTMLEANVGTSMAMLSQEEFSSMHSGEDKSKSFEGAGGDPKVCSETLHIFSVASGLQYERLLRIMIMSVREHTKCPLRIWLVENFLSPSFRRLLPGLAKEVGFAVSRVTYKWPTWLREQTQKQRVIWAYKILFLDVFFPAEVKRVLFIDADQIVRADVKELWDTNLGDSVYGMVPFCGSGPQESVASSLWSSLTGGGKASREDLRNPETEGFRFWEQGYWQNHLGQTGSHYHISALFVVDLEGFRKKAAGDILRDTYQSLTADPNSLANLDQDLPNFVQMKLPIFSLPQEWLWCESWCSNSSKAHAKTIDMCQNPVRKEGKLLQAKRIAPEWSVYDEKIQKIIDKLEK